MREYELTVIYDLAVAEAGGPDASVEQLTNLIETRGGKMVRVDHWGRRRMAYPIKRAIDGDYIVSRVELDPATVTTIEGLLRIDERVYRHMVVRADELPAPAAPREARPAQAAQPATNLPSTAEARTPDNTEAEAQPEGSLPVTEPVTAAEAVEHAREHPTAPETVASEAPAAEPITEPLRDATPESSTTGFTSEASEINTGIDVEDLEEHKATGPHTEQDSPTDETTL